MPNWIAFADGSAKLLAAITAFSWPLIVGVVAWKLLPYIRDVLKSQNFSIEVAGLKIGAQNFSDQVQLQIEDLQKKVSELRAAQLQQTSAPGVAPIYPIPPPPYPIPPSPYPTPPLPLPQAQSSPPPRILWVDDHPENNAFQIARLKSKNIDVIEARSTSEAMQLLSGGRGFGAVISDMGRQEDRTFHARAGIELMDQMQKLGIALPVFFFTTSSQVDRLRDDPSATRMAGVTSSPVELFEMLRPVLGRDV
jgi:CheY-like chemotaxis protein